MAAAQAALPNASVAVTIGTVTGTGLRSRGEKSSDFETWGEDGIDTNHVRVNAGTFSEPTKGDTITVAGSDVFVTRVFTDAAGAMFDIYYQNERPVEGV